MRSSPSEACHTHSQLIGSFMPSNQDQPERTTIKIVRLDIEITAQTSTMISGIWGYDQSGSSTADQNINMHFLAS